MKTPYDAAMRLRQRELDEVVSAINAEANALGSVESEKARLAASVSAEADLAASDPAFTSPGWQRRVRGERQALTARQLELQARLEALRATAVDTYGVLRGIENAADAFRAEAERSAAAAEQSAGDDRSATLFLQARAIRRGAAK